MTCTNKIIWTRDINDQTITKEWKNKNVNNARVGEI